MACAPRIYAIRWRVRRGPQPGAAGADTEAAALPLRRLIGGGKGIPDRGRPPRRPASVWVARRRSMAPRAAAALLPCAARSPVGRHIVCGRSCHHRCRAISPPFPPFFPELAVPRGTVFAWGAQERSLWATAYEKQYTRVMARICPSEDEICSEAPVNARRQRTMWTKDFPARRGFSLQSANGAVAWPRPCPCDLGPARPIGGETTCGAAAAQPPASVRDAGTPRRPKM